LSALIILCSVASEHSSRAMRSSREIGVLRDASILWSWKIRSNGFHGIELPPLAQSHQSEAPRFSFSGRHSPTALVTSEVSQLPFLYTKDQIAGPALRALVSAHDVLLSARVRLKVTVAPGVCIVIRDRKMPKDSSI
jgi:hypothetical protein